MSTGNPRRSILVTLLGVVMVACGGLVSIISFFSLLMIIAGSYGTANTTAQGFLLMVVAPPLTAISGLGLIFRWRWALLALVAGLVIVLAWGTMELARFAVEPHYGSDFTYFAGIALASALLLAFALTRGVRREFGWLAGRTQAGGPPSQPGPEHTGRSGPYGRSVGDGAKLREIDPARTGPATAQQYWALTLFICILLGIAGGASWLMVAARNSGSIRLPVGRGVQTITATRVEEPAMYWFGMGLHGAVVLLCGGLALWMLRHAIFPAKPRGHTYLH